jgi:hypothetical protein
MPSAPDHIGYGPVSMSNAVTNETLSGARTVTFADANILRLDPGGSARDVILPAEADSAGVVYEIINAASGAENLVIKDDGASTIGTINQNEMCKVACDGSAWSLLYVSAIALS